MINLVALAVIITKIYVFKQTDRQTDGRRFIITL